jgi:hypothetical protein
MIGEAMAACAEAMQKPLSFSPPGIPSVEEVTSPVYMPNPTNWDRLAELNEEAHALANDNVIHFGPRVQQEIDGQVVTTGITEQVAELILDERRNAIVESLFVPCAQPVLETPAPQRQQKKTIGRAKIVKIAPEGLRRSSRQKAKISSVSVSKRATQRLIRAFDLVGPNELIGEEALAAFARRFGTPLSSQKIQAVRKLTSLDCEQVMAATMQLMAAEGAATMEDRAA